MRIGLFGLPGAGKGTQAERISKHWAIPHVSTGEMFRELQTGTSELAQEIRAILASGQLVSDEMVTKLAFDRLKRADCQRGFVLDGYPRTLPQAEALQQSPFALDGLICIEVDRSEIIDRLSGRRVCERCNAVFGSESLVNREATCPHDGSVLVQRADDAPEAVKTRLGVFEKNFSPVVRFYEAMGRLFPVDGNGSVDAVSERLCSLIGSKWA